MTITPCEEGVKTTEEIYVPRVTHFEVWRDGERSEMRTLSPHQLKHPFKPFLLRYPRRVEVGRNRTLVRRSSFGLKRTQGGTILIRPVLGVDSECHNGQTHPCRRIMTLTYSRWGEPILWISVRTTNRRSLYSVGGTRDINDKINTKVDKS